VTAMAQLIADLCQGLGLDRIDLIGNDTGGVVAQVVAASQPELLRSLVLTNCDTEGNFPPQAFMPVIEAAVRGEIAPLLTVDSLAGRPGHVLYSGHPVQRHADRARG